MVARISACIAAHNEGKSIRNTLESILSQTYPPHEILVCANACTDNTADVAKSVDSSIQVIETAQKGKPNAWNILNAAAKHNYRFFVDGDVYVDSHAFKHLVARLHVGDLTCVVGQNVPIRSDKFVERLFYIPEHPQSCIIGRLYAFDASKLQQRMKAHGYPTMPIDIIHEDLWLTGIVGRMQHQTCKDAKVHFRPYEINDIFRMIKRGVRAEKQIRLQYPHLWKELQEDVAHSTPARFLHRNLERLRKLAYLKTSDKIEQLVGFPVRRIVRAYALYQVSQEKEKLNLDGWEIAQSTKHPIFLS